MNKLKGGWGIIDGKWVRGWVRRLGVSMENCG